MENVYRFTPESGAILVTTLLFLVIITLLTLSVIQVGLLETKMSQNYRNKIFATQMAETKLAAAERQLWKGETQTNGQVILISEALCGVKFYRVKAIGTYHNTSSTVQSTYAVINPNASCNPKPEITSGRKSWREIS